MEGTRPEPPSDGRPPTRKVLPGARVIRNMQAIVAPGDRRRALRRLDDILEALEQLNLQEQMRLSAALIERLEELGIAQPAQHPIPHLIELVWERQQPYLITLNIDRRRRRRRSPGADSPPWELPELGPGR